MAKINLLPWREEKRKQRQQTFIFSLGAAVVVTCLLFGGVYMHIEGLKAYQTERNTRWKDEITKVDKKIAEIKSIEEKKAKLNEKITLIQDLQASRPGIVHVFDELRKITPVGIYVVSLEKKGEEITLIGKSQSSSRVSEYMRAIDRSLFFKDPKLKFVKGLENKTNAKNESDDFTMTFQQKKDKPKDTPPSDVQPQPTPPAGA